MRRVLLSAGVLVAMVGCKPTEYDVTGEPHHNDPPAEEEEQPPVDGEPVADAGPDQEVAPLDTVILNGSASYDPNGLAITEYEWVMTSKPSGSTAVLQDMGSAATKSFFADLAGDYVFTLTVKNDNGVWDSTPDELIITAVPGDGFYVQMSWDTATDQDLHILDSPATIWSNPGDCSWCNLNPDWGNIGIPDDDPSLDYDTIDGFGPETTTIDSPTSGSYRVQVHFYGQDGGTECLGICPSTQATVDVYIGGVFVQSFTGTLTDAGQVWDVATIEWPSQNIITHNQMSYTTESYCGF